MKHSQIPIDDLTFHVVESGEGPAVLFCHGFPDLWRGWRRQMEALATAGYRAIALDMRGYGRSSAPTDPHVYSPAAHRGRSGRDPGCAQQPGFDLTAAYRGTKVTQPSFFLTGALDGVRRIRPTTEEELRAGLPNLRGFVELSGVGHWPQWEAPEVVNAALLSFLESLN